MTTRFYCPRCCKDFGEDVARCPHCGFNIHELWNSKDYVEKLILALDHPEPSTAVNAAWVLGRLKDSEAVDALINLVKKTQDVYVARAAARALGEIGTEEALQFLATLVHHPAEIVRQEAMTILAVPKWSSFLHAGSSRKKGDNDEA